MDILASLTGSRVRADVLAVLFGIRPRSWRPMELEHATRRPHQLVGRELRRLVTAGVLRVRVIDGKRQYEAGSDGPVTRELAALVRQTRGRIPRIRHALVALRSRTVAWLVAGAVMDPLATGRPRRRAALIVVTGAPRSLVRVQLANVAGDEVEIHCMSVREWITRLEKGDVALRRARRARKLWVLGSWEALASREQSEIEARRTFRSAMANWREELSDEWDEDWDPFASLPGPA